MNPLLSLKNFSPIHQYNFSRGVESEICPLCKAWKLDYEEEPLQHKLGCQFHPENYLAQLAAAVLEENNLLLFTIYGLIQGDNISFAKGLVETSKKNSDSISGHIPLLEKLFIQLTKKP